MTDIDTRTLTNPNGSTFATSDVFITDDGIEGAYDALTVSSFFERSDGEPFVSIAVHRVDADGNRKFATISVRNRDEILKIMNVLAKAL